MTRSARVAILQIKLPIGYTFIKNPKLMLTTNHRWLAAWIVAVGLFAAGGVTEAQAQRTPGSLGLGGQIGSPSGITLKVYNPNTISYDVLAAWDLGDFFFLNVHGLYERPLDLEGTSGVEYFFGPGGYIGFEDRRVGPPGRDDDTDTETVLGISGRLGINVPFEDRFEFFVQITPRINLIPDTEGDFGGGVGLRYYFDS